MQFSNKLTEEEELLYKAYARLKRKKKLLQSFRNPNKQDAKPQEEPTNKISSDDAAKSTEQAKKLLKSGAIKVESDKKEQQGFKRSKRMKENSDKNAPVGFQPFLSSLSEQNEEDITNSQKGGINRKHLFESFVTSKESQEPDDSKDNDSPNSYSPNSPFYVKDKEKISSSTNEEMVNESPFHGNSPYKNKRAVEKCVYDPKDKEKRDRQFRQRNERPYRDRERDVPQKGNTIYVRGHGINEDLLQKVFSNIGHVINITMEPGKNCGFLTFDKIESADEAIAQINGTMVSEIQLHVSMARRQPSLEGHTTNEQSSSSWSSIAASNAQIPVQNQKESSSENTEGRQLVKYDVAEDDIFN